MKKKVHKKRKVKKPIKIKIKQTVCQEGYKISKSGRCIKDKSYKKPIVYDDKPLKNNQVIYYRIPVIQNYRNSLDKKDPYVKKEQSIKKEPYVKNEPSVKKEPSVKTINIEIPRLIKREPSLKINLPIETVKEQPSYKQELMRNVSSMGDVLKAEVQKIKPNFKKQFKIPDYSSQNRLLKQRLKEQGPKVDDVNCNLLPLHPRCQKEINCYSSPDNQICIKYNMKGGYLVRIGDTTEYMKMF